MGSLHGTDHVSTEELFRQHSGFVARFLARLGVPPDHIEDALQEVFLVVHRHGGYRPGIAKPTSYLANIAIRAASQYRRRQAVARTRSSEAKVERMASDTEDPAHALQTQQDLERLQLALQRLPDDLRTTLLLVEVEGESCISVAAGLGCPVGTIYWRLHQARKRLQVALNTLNAPRREARAQPDHAPLDKRAVPMGSLIMFGMFDFHKSESARLLRLAREQGVSGALTEGRIARHQELLQSGAQLPAWASNWAPHSASWVSVVGVGPIAAGVTAVGAVTAVLMLGPGSEPKAHPRQESAPVTAAVVPPAAPAAPLAPEAQPKKPSAEAAVAEPAPVALARPPFNKEAPARKAPFNRPGLGSQGGREATRSASTAQATTSPSAASGEASPQADRAAEAAEEPKEEAPKPEEQAAAAAQAPRADDATVAEMREIAQAERLLESDPEQALELTRSMRQRFEGGYFAEERVYVEVMALKRLGRASELRKKAEYFLRRYPDGPYTTRVREALASAASKN